MTINELRNITKMSQREFAMHFGIPVGTLRNWEQGIATPPEYVFKMIFASMRRDKMINVETIKFIKMLDALAELSKNGIEPFEKANESTWRNKIFYDTRKPATEEGYKVVLDACIIDDPHCYHHDIISYYDSDSFEYTIGVIIDEEGNPYVKVKLLLSGYTIVIAYGDWHIVDRDFELQF